MKGQKLRLQNVLQYKRNSMQLQRASTRAVYCGCTVLWLVLHAEDFVNGSVVVTFESVMADTSTNNSAGRRLSILHAHLEHSNSTGPCLLTQPCSAGGAPSLTGQLLKDQVQQRTRLHVLAIYPLSPTLYPAEPHSVLRIAPLAY